MIKKVRKLSKKMMFFIFMVASMIGPNLIYARKAILRNIE
jgi:hypothetical protein